MATKLGFKLIPRNTTINISSDNSGVINSINLNFNSIGVTDIGPVTEGIPMSHLNQEQFPAYPGKLPTFTTWQELINFIVTSVYESPANIAAIGADQPA